MQSFLPSLRSRQHSIRPLVDPVRQDGNSKETSDVDILCPDNKIEAFFQCMGEHIVTGEPSVSDKNRTSAVRIPVYKLAQGSKFIFLSDRLDDNIQISF